MLTTQTGNFPIGYRRGWSDWNKDINGLLSWAQENELGVVDLGGETKDVAAVTEKWLKVGSIDLAAWQGLLSPDAGKRADAVAKNAAYIEEACGLGANKFFLVVLDADWLELWVFWKQFDE